MNTKKEDQNWKDGEVIDTKVLIEAHPKSSEDETHVFNFTYYIFSLLASINLGTKMFLITFAKWNEFWIYFIEHVGMWMTWLTVISIIIQYKKYQNKAKGIDRPIQLEIFKNKKAVLFSCLTGIFIALGNIAIIFAMKHAHKSGASPSTITSILNLNVLMMLIVGLLAFNEHHKPVKYIGGLVVLSSILVVATHRRFESKTKYTDEENHDFKLSIIYVLITTVAWGAGGISWKYTFYYKGSDPIEFTTVAMTTSGLFGSCMIIVIVIFQIPFELGEGYSFSSTVFFCYSWGVLTATALYMQFKAFSIGSAEISQLWVNTKVLVQMGEELLVFHSLPTPVAFLGVIGVLLGMTIMVFSKEKKNLGAVGHKENKNEVEMSDISCEINMD